MWIFEPRDDALMALFEDFGLVLWASELGVLGVACRFPLFPRTSYSHSIVAGGLLVMSYTTRFTPGTSATIRPEMRANTS